MARSISEIAREIREKWKPVHGEAEQIVDAMERINSLNDTFSAEPAIEILSRFRWAARTWKGPVAKRIKDEIEALLTSKTAAASA
jgi:hypothetical protein